MRYLGFTDRMHARLGGAIVSALMFGFWLGIMRSFHGFSLWFLPVLAVNCLLFPLPPFLFDLFLRHLREQRGVVTLGETLLTLCLYMGYTACGHFAWNILLGLCAHSLHGFGMGLLGLAASLLFSVNRQACLGRMVHFNDIYGVLACPKKK